MKIFFFFCAFLLFLFVYCFCSLFLVSIIAVSYEARDFGVTRTMRGDEAKEKCPDITLVRVPEARGKANLTHYREAGAEVIAVLSRFCDNCERASVDEALSLIHI